MRSKSLAAILVVGIALSMFAVPSAIGYGGSAVVTPSGSCLPSTNPFMVIGTSWGTQASPLSAAPGDLDVPLTVNLLYTGGCVLTVASFEATLATPISAANGTNQSTTYEVNVPTNSILTETYHVNIAASAQLGAYTIPLYIGYNTTNYAGVFFQSTNFTITLKGSVQLEYAASTTTLTPGEVTQVKIAVGNNGTGTANDITTTVAASPTVSLLNSLPEIHSLAPGASVAQTLSIYAPLSSSESPVTLTFGGTYTDGYGTPRSASQSVGMFVAEVPPAVSPIGLTVEPSSLEAGTANNLTITISNNGTSAIESLSTGFSLGGGLTWLSPDLFQIASLAPGAQVKVQARAYDPATSPAAVQLDVALKYTYQNTTTQETRYFGLLSRGVIDIEMTGVTVLPQVTAPGQVVSVTLTITNVGVIEASGVTAQAQMPAALQPIGSASDFIGDMQVDSPYTFTLSAIVTNSTAAGTYDIPVTLSYLDNLRSHLSETLNVTVAVGAATTTGTTSNVARQSGFTLLILLTYVVFAAAVLVLAVLYLRQRRLSKSLNR